MIMMMTLESWWWWWSHVLLMMAQFFLLCFSDWMKTRQDRKKNWIFLARSLGFLTSQTLMIHLRRGIHSTMMMMTAMENGGWRDCVVCLSIVPRTMRKKKFLKEKKSKKKNYEAKLMMMVDGGEQETQTARESKVFKGERWWWWFLELKGLREIFFRLCFCSCAFLRFFFFFFFVAGWMNVGLSQSWLNLSPCESWRWMRQWEPAHWITVWRMVKAQSLSLKLELEERGREERLAQTLARYSIWGRENFMGPTRRRRCKRGWVAGAWANGASPPMRARELVSVCACV